MTETREALEAMRNTLSDPGAWTTGASARDEDRQTTDVYGIDAVSWCLIGALWRHTDRGAQRQAAKQALLTVINLQLPAMGIRSFNDAPGRTLDEILAVIDGAIAVEDAC